MAFKHIGIVAGEAEDYIEKRRKGLIKSCKTGFPKLDTAVMWEYGSVISIGGRPSVGKTSFSSCLLRGILKNNDIANLEILDYAWEMSGRSLIIRELSAVAKQTYANIISQDEDNPVSDVRMKEYKEILEVYKNFPWYLEEEPKTAAQFGDNIARRVANDPKKKRIVRIDHSILAKQAASEGSQVTMLQNLLNQCVELKKQSDIIFIVLTQIGRDFEDRQEDGSPNAYPKRSDPFGGDAVAQSSETVILLNKPAQYSITYYGPRPNGIKVEEDDLFAHIVKNRNSAPDLILHYKENFKNMNVKEY